MVCFTVSGGWIVSFSEQIIKQYFKNGRVPWSVGYGDFRWEKISQSINDAEILKQFANNRVPPEFGIGLDERVLEYPWLLSRLNVSSGRLLDAGSTFNYEI